MSDKVKRFRRFNRFYDFQGAPLAPKLRPLSERERTKADMEPMEANITLTLTQADRVFAKFGGAAKLHKALHAVGKPRTLTSLYYWNYGPEKGGSAGVIPAHAMNDVLLAARFDGVVLTPEELDPRPVTMKSNLFAQIDMTYLSEETRKKITRLSKHERRAFKRQFRSGIDQMKREERRRYNEERLKKKQEEEERMKQERELMDPVIEVEWDDV